MIDFPCHCGHRFAVADDLAGGLIQCPRCKRLNDVPLPGELASLDEGGIFKLDESPVQPADPQRLGELTRVFTLNHHDSSGQPIDLRTTAPGAARGGSAPLPVEPIPVPPPKYDPFTGELIQALEVKPDDRPTVDTPLPLAKRAPVPATKLVNGMDLPHPLEVFLIPLRLLMPLNLVVMFFIILAHAIAQAMMVPIAGFYWMLVPFWVALHCLVIAHFGNVIDETGPTSRDELPTPLRAVSWHEDTFGPFARIIIALAVCYGPGFVLLFSTTRVPAAVILSLSAALTIIGTILFPAAVLTTTTSGSILNLRPDRVVGVALACGAEYFIAIITWTAGGALYVAGAVCVTWVAAVVLNESIRAAFPMPAWVNWYSAYGILAAGIYLLHFLGWHLGTLYRKHHERFPWVLQRYLGKRPAAASGFPVAPPPPGPDHGSVNPG